MKHLSNKTSRTKVLMKSSLLQEHALFLGNVLKQGNKYTIKGNKRTREPGTKKGNIRGIPVFLEKN